jgi:hypothetical protein
MLPRRAHEGAQLLHVGCRGARTAQRVSASSPASSSARQASALVQLQRVARTAQARLRHRLAQRRVVHLAHEPADVLHLAPPALVRARAPVLHHRLAQGILHR